ncbi:MAG: hypothetical protein U0841_02140 [Chloroflexia bacterium]
MLAVALFSPEPTMLGHGRIVHTDIAALAYLVALLALYAYAARPTWVARRCWAKWWVRRSSMAHSLVVLGRSCDWTAGAVSGRAAPGTVGGQSWAGGCCAGGDRRAQCRLRVPPPGRWKRSTSPGFAPSTPPKPGG